MPTKRHLNRLHRLFAVVVSLILVTMLALPPAAATASTASPSAAESLAIAAPASFQSDPLAAPLSLVRSQSTYDAA